LSADIFDHSTDFQSDIKSNYCEYHGYSSIQLNFIIPLRPNGKKAFVLRIAPHKNCPPGTVSAQLPHLKLENNKSQITKPQTMLNNRNSND
jgi:hypothetical protein